MPYPRYTSYSTSSGGGHGGSGGRRSGGSVNPWDDGGGLFQSGGGGHMGHADHMTSLVGNLVGALMGNQQMSSRNQVDLKYMRTDDRHDRRRGRDRSPIRRPRSRSRDRSRRRSPPRRKRSPPRDRGEVEIYIGNYPHHYKEENLKALFDEHEVEIGKIRTKMTGDGNKVFAFVEVPKQEMVEKAKRSMDDKLIEGRRIIVRGTKLAEEQKREAERASRKERNHQKDDKKRNREQKPRIPKVEDSKNHLVTAFIEFIDREIKKQTGEENQDTMGLLEASKTALKAAFGLPDDDTYKTPREIEDIFFKAARLDIKLPPEPEAEKVEECGAEDKAEEGGEGDGEDQPAKKAKLELEAADSENVNDDEAENVATENGKEAEEEGEEERKEEEDATVDEMEAEEADTQVPDPTDNAAEEDIAEEDDEIALTDDEQMIEDLENVLAGADDLFDGGDKVADDDNNDETKEADHAEEIMEEAENEKVEMSPQKKNTPTRGRGRGRRGRK